MAEAIVNLIGVEVLEKLKADAAIVNLVAVEVLGRAGDAAIVNLVYVELLKNCSFRDFLHVRQRG